MPYPSISDGPFLNTDEAAAMLGVHPKRLQGLARSGRIRAYRIGKLWRFQASDLWADVAVRVAPLNELYERAAPMPGI
jgi:excisionase family DNA binding protein